MKYILSKIAKGIVFLIFIVALAGGLTAGFMYVSTGEVDIERFKAELYSDYTDMSFTRPPKDNYFSLAMRRATPGGEGVEESPMSEEYKNLYDGHLKRMEKDLVYLEQGDSSYLDDDDMVPVLTGEVTESIKNVDENIVRYEDEVMVLTLNGRDALEDERVKASNSAYVSALTELSIAIEDRDKEKFEESIDSMDKAGDILVNGVPEE